MDPQAAVQQTDVGSELGASACDRCSTRQPGLAYQPFRPSPLDLLLPKKMQGVDAVITSCTAAPATSHERPRYAASYTMIGVPGRRRRELAMHHCLIWLQVHPIQSAWYERLCMVRRRCSKQSGTKHLESLVKHDAHDYNIAWHWPAARSTEGTCKGGHKCNRHARQTRC